MYAGNVGRYSQVDPRVLVDSTNSQPNEARYVGMQIHPNQARYGGSQVQPNQARYGGSQVQPNQARYGGSQVQPNQVRYGGSQVQPNQAGYVSSQVQPIQAHYAGMQVQPNKAYYADTQVQLNQARFAGTQGHPSCQYATRPQTNGAQLSVVDNGFQSLAFTSPHDAAFIYFSQTKAQGLAGTGVSMPVSRAPTGPDKVPRNEIISSKYRLILFLT